VGEIVRARLEVQKCVETDLEGLIEAVARASGLRAEEICSKGKARAIVIAKEALIIVGRELGGSTTTLARVIGIDSSAVSRRFESGKARLKATKEMQDLVSKIRKFVAR
jgi:chromosomal replication initiation ATPase DnaA